MNKERLDFQNQEQIEKIWKEVKKDGYTNKHLLVKDAEFKGLGVFAKNGIKQGQIIEFCHSIVLSWKRRYVNDPSIIKYAYWSPCNCSDCQTHGNSGMLLLGNGSIYNSAPTAEERNADFFVYPKLGLGIFVALKPIKAGEEILTWWGQSYYDSWCKKQESKKTEKQDTVAQAATKKNDI
jgi:SET domain-containing protein